MGDLAKPVGRPET